MAQERILIVDGDINLSEMLKAKLEAIGYIADCACNGIETLDILESRWVDLIVLDIVLKGGMNGFEFFKEIKMKKRLSKIPIIVQSSKSAMKKTFEMLGAEIFLIKPCSIDLFLKTIKNIFKNKVNSSE